MKNSLLFLPFFLVLLSAAPTLLTGKIIGISDGDTVTLLVAGMPYKIRLNGVDCPESHQAYGQKAKQFTSDMVFNKQVSVDVYGTDRYGRNIGEVFLPGKISLNKELVRNGFAWHYKQYSKDPELDELEQEARTAKRGLWADKSPTPPWEFRRAKKNRSQKKDKSAPAYNPQNVADIDENGDISILKESVPKRHLELPQKNSDAIVIYNVNSHKCHCPNCPAAARCTKNCIQIPAVEAKNRSGIPCQICGGCGY